MQLVKLKSNWEEILSNSYSKWDYIQVNFIRNFVDSSGVYFKCLDEITENELMIRVEYKGSDERYGGIKINSKLLEPVDFLDVI